MKKLICCVVLFFVVGIVLFAQEPVIINTSHGKYYITVTPDATTPYFGWGGNKIYENAIREMDAIGIRRFTLPKSVVDAIFDYVRREYSWRVKVEVSIMPPNLGWYIMFINNDGSRYVIFEPGRD